MTDIDLSDLPASPHKQPLPPVVPFSRLRARLGITDETYLAAAAAPAAVEGTELKLHREYDRQRYDDPDEWSGCEGTLRIFDRTGAVWLAQCDVCRFEVGFRAADLEPGIRTAHLLERAELDARFLDVAFEQTPETADARAAVRAWLREDVLLPAPALWGRPGRGKSHLAVVAVRELITRRGTRALFRTTPQLLAGLQAAFETLRYEKLWQEAVTVPLLALDDLGAEMSTDWRAQCIDALIDERYRRELPLVVTTNFAPGDWAEAFGARSASRLAGMTFAVELGGTDWRQRGQQLGLAGSVAA